MPCLCKPAFFDKNMIVPYLSVIMKMIAALFTFLLLGTTGEQISTQSVILRIGTE